MRACPSCNSVYATEAEFCGLDGERLIVAEGDPLAGKVIVKYRLEELLGMGANGCVYRATNLETASPLAIKILFGEMACDRRVVARFRREAEAVSKMRHPNVVSIHDFGTAPSGLTYLAMELLVGRTLETAMAQDGRFPPERAAKIAQQVSAGLSEAHRLGFVHRDLKPGNVMLIPEMEGGETAKILDFGIAMSMRGTDQDGRLTKTGYVVGTPLYMAPEQIDESFPLGPQADVYALGSIMYEMLAGRPPFVGSVEQVLVKKMTRMPDPLPDAGEIGTLALRLLERDPRQRPPTALHVSAEIVRLIDDDPKTVLAPVPAFHEDSSVMQTDVAMRPIVPDPSELDSFITSTDMQAIDPAALFAAATASDPGMAKDALQTKAAVREDPTDGNITLSDSPRTAVEEVVARLSKAPAIDPMASTAPPASERSPRSPTSWSPGGGTYLLVIGTGLAIGALLYVFTR